MKVLLISDEENLLNNCNSFFKSNGLDTICYKWLLKALDNIEEIQPDLIVLSSSEYPRHWKTLVQFVKSGIGGQSVKVFLYEPTPLKEDDEEKAKALGITGCFSSLDQKNLLDTFSDFIKSSFIPVPNNVSTEDDFEEDIEVPTVDSIVNDKKTGHIVLTNPTNKNLIAGKVSEFNNHRIEAVMDFNLSGIANNDLIDYVTYFDSEECFSFSAEIYILNEENKTVILTIKEKYEEK